MEVSASFNKKLQSGNTYDLTEIITLTGFDGYKVTYELGGDAKIGISIEGINLIIEDSFSGDFSVNVLAEEKGEIKADAKGFVYNFSLSFSDFTVNTGLAENSENTKKNWTSIIGEEKKKEVKGK